MSKLDRLTDTIKQCSIAVHEGREVRLSYRQRWFVVIGTDQLKVETRDGAHIHIHRGHLYLGHHDVGSSLYLDLALPAWGIHVSELDLSEVQRKARSLAQPKEVAS